MERRLLETKTAIAQLPKDRGRPQNRVDYTCAAARPGRWILGSPEHRRFRAQSCPRPRHVDTCKEKYRLVRHSGPRPGKSVFEDTGRWYQLYELWLIDLRESTLLAAGTSHWPTSTIIYSFEFQPTRPLFQWNSVFKFRLLRQFSQFYSQFSVSFECWNLAFPNSRILCVCQTLMSQRRACNYVRSEFRNWLLCNRVTRNTTQVSSFHLIPLSFKSLKLANRYAGVCRCDWRSMFPVFNLRYEKTRFSLYKLERVKFSKPSTRNSAIPWSYGRSCENFNAPVSE